MFPKILMVVCAAFGIVSNLNAQSGPVDSFNVRVNTIGSAEVHLVFYFSKEINAEATSKESSDYEYAGIAVKSAANGSKGLSCDNERCIAVGSFTLSFVFSSDKETITEYFMKGAPIYLELPAPFKVRFEDSSSFALQPKLVRELTLAKLSLTDRQFEMMQRVWSDNYDFSRQDIAINREISERDSSSADYVAEFAYQRQIGQSRFQLRSQGRLSTEASSPLNQLQFGIILPSKLWAVGNHDLRVSGKGFLEALLSTNQRFDTSLLEARTGLQLLLPNFLDLTSGENRLRLKPEVKLGVAYARPLQRQQLYDNKKEVIELFASGHYYLPVHSQLALDVEAESSYGKDITLNNHCRSYISITLAYDLPFQDLKTMITWQSGGNSTAIETDQQLLIGFLIDNIPL